MNWLLMPSTKASSGVGTVVKPMTRAVLSGGATSEDDAVGVGTTGAITTRTATPIDTIIRVATAETPTLPYPLVVPFSQARLLDAWVSRSEQACCRSVRRVISSKFRIGDSAQQSISGGNHTHTSQIC